jgi:hypothetical protein
VMTNMRPVLWPSWACPHTLAWGSYPLLLAELERINPMVWGCLHCHLILLAAALLCHNQGGELSDKFLSLCPTEGASLKPTQNWVASPTHPLYSHTSVHTQHYSAGRNVKWCSHTGKYFSSFSMFIAACPLPKTY